LLAVKLELGLIGAIMSDVTLVLNAISRGEKKASEKLLSLVYNELRKMAAARMLRESAGHIIQPTALMHEAWLQLVGEHDRSWRNPRTSSARRRPRCGAS
jgi:hypothetical protein